MVQGVQIVTFHACILKRTSVTGPVLNAVFSPPDRRFHCVTA
jgi:hypothetical protein